MTNFVGTSGWSYDHWTGRFYPQDIDRRKWLEFYCREFDTVELNSSFYRLPRRKTFENWRNRSPKNFIFSVKMSRYVSHVKRLIEPEKTLSKFFESVSGLREKCGPILIQLPPSLGFEQQRAENFFRELEKYNYKLTLECRNKSWFFKDSYNLMKEYNIALCLADTPHFPYAEEITSDFVYIRLHGHERLYASNYSEEQLQGWVEKIRGWNKKKKMNCYVYFDNDANAYAVDNAIRLKEILSD